MLLNGILDGIDLKSKVEILSIIDRWEAIFNEDKNQTLSRTEDASGAIKDNPWRLVSQW